MNRKIRLVVFDLDGTLTPVDSLWSYLHQALGTWETGRMTAERYMRGELTYQEWAEADAKCWVGVHVSRILEILDQIPYRDGADRVFRTLKERKIRTAILSAGLSILVDKAARRFGVDISLSNTLRSNDGRLTGEIDVRVGLREKKRLVEQIAEKLGVSLSEVALVGDRSNDLSHPECLRIAFKPKDAAARQLADFVVEDDDLSGILQYLA